MRFKSKKIDWFKFRIRTLYVGFAFLIIVFLAGYYFFGRLQELQPSYVSEVQGKNAVFVYEQREWFQGSRDILLNLNDMLRTGKDGLQTVSLDPNLKAYLLPNTGIEMKRSTMIEGGGAYNLRLAEGDLIVMARPGSEHDGVEVSVPGNIKELKFWRFYMSYTLPAYSAYLREGAARFTWDEDEGEGQIYVLDGELVLNLPFPWNRKVVGAPNKVTIRKNHKLIRSDVMLEADWEPFLSIYNREETETVDETAKEKFLSTGNFFKHVWNHSFSETGGKAYIRPIFSFVDESPVLIFFYDVFNSQSRVEVAFNTRNFNLANFSEISFEGSLDAVFKTPAYAYLEFRSGGDVVHATPVKFNRKGWIDVKVPVEFKDSTPISKIVFCVENETVGVHKRGIFKLRNFDVK